MYKNGEKEGGNKKTNSEIRSFMDGPLAFYNALGEIFIVKKGHPLRRKGCFFHMKKAVIEKVCSTQMGFYRRYFDPEDESFRTCIKLWPSLSTVPIVDMHIAVNDLTRHTLLLFPELNDYVMYFTETWAGLPGGNGGRFHLEFWNIRDR